MAKVLIIAEAGVNHNGDINLARQLIDKAKEAGADIIKFQTYNLDSIVSKFAEMADYQKDNMGMVESQKEMLKKITLPYEAFWELYKYCKNKDIQFL